MKSLFTLFRSTLLAATLFLTACATTAKTPPPSPGEPVQSPVIKNATVGPNPHYPMRSQCSPTQVTCLEGTHQDCSGTKKSCKCFCVKD